MHDQTIAASVGRGSQFRRTKALRELTRRTQGRLAFDSYNRDGSVGQYRVLLREPEAPEQEYALVMDGPTVDAFIVGYEAAIITMANLQTVVRGTPAQQLVDSTITRPVAVTEAHDNPLGTPHILTANHDVTTTITWVPIADADHYTVNLRQLEPLSERSNWKTIANPERARITLNDLTPGHTYAVRVRAISGQARTHTNSPLSPAVSFTVPTHKAQLDLTPNNLPHQT